MGLYPNRRESNQLCVEGAGKNEISIHCSVEIGFRKPAVIIGKICRYFRAIRRYDNKTPLEFRFADRTIIRELNFERHSFRV